MRGAQLGRKSQEHQLIQQSTRARHTRCTPILIAFQHFLKKIQRERREVLRSNQRIKRFSLCQLLITGSQCSVRGMGSVQ